MGQILHFKSKFLKSIPYWNQILESNKFVEKAVGTLTQIAFLKRKKGTYLKEEPEVLLLFEYPAGLRQPGSVCNRFYSGGMAQREF